MLAVFSLQVTPQWGFKEDDDPSFIFPIAFNTVLVPVSMVRTRDNDNLCWHTVNSWTNTQIKIGTNSYEGRTKVTGIGYIVLGK